MLYILCLAQLLVAIPLKRMNGSHPTRYLVSALGRISPHSYELGWVFPIGPFLAFRRVGGHSSPRGAGPVL